MSEPMSPGAILAEQDAIRQLEAERDGLPQPGAEARPAGPADGIGWEDYDRSVREGPLPEYQHDRFKLIFTEAGLTPREAIGLASAWAADPASADVDWRERWGGDAERNEAAVQ